VRVDRNQGSNKERGARRLDFAVTISCLALLAMMAVPRHSVFTSEIRRQQVAALSASVRSAAQLGHALWRANGEPLVLAMPRGRVMMIDGYPTPADLRFLLDDSEGMAFRASRGTWQHRDLPVDRPCGLTYSAPARAGDEPAVRPHLDGC
jgi:hypothetical protein